MTPFERHLRAAEGYIELDMPADANETVQDLEPSDERELTALLRMKAAALTDLGEWAQLEPVAQQLSDRQPEDWRWPLALATAKRKTRCLEAALDVLLHAVKRLPEASLIHYNLACYQAQIGNLEAARTSLAEAIRLDAALKNVFMVDRDLAPLRESDTGSSS